MAHNYKVYLSFEVAGDPDAFDQLTDRMLRDAIGRAFPYLRSSEFDVLGVDKVCSECENAPAPGSELCFSCQDSLLHTIERAGETEP